MNHAPQSSSASRIRCCMWLLLAITNLGGCAVESATTQYLDSDTGATIFRAGKTLELVSTGSEEGLRRAEFARTGPFWVNRMGDYRLFLWVSFVGGRFDIEPVDVNTDELMLEADDIQIPLRIAARERRELGVGEAVYPPVASWETAGYYEIDRESLQRIADAEILAITITPTDDRFESLEDAPKVLKSFNELAILTKP